MKLALLLVATLTIIPSPVDAKSNPPQITWEWFGAAETYKRYPNRTRNDLLIAARYHRMAALKGNTSSAYKLAEMYENGIGVNQDYKAALRWYQAAADGGDKHGEFRVGYFYQKGLAVPQDMLAARYWYERSARQDNEWAFHMLAFMFADGDGVEKDVSLARRYFEISLPRTDDHWAKWKLATLIEASDPRHARQLLRESAAQGNTQAADLLRQHGW